MNQRMDDDLSGEVASKRPASTAVAAVGSLSTSCSRDGEDFQAQVERNIQAARHGHGGLETALHLMCERLLDLGVCWEEMLKEQKRAEEKYLELQQDCLDQQKHLSTLNDSLRQDLCVLESRVEDLARAKASLPKNESTNDEIVGVVEMMVAAATCGRNVDVETIPAIRQELLALKRKVDIIAANVLGEAESMNMETASATGGVEKEGPLLYNSDDDIAGERGKDVEEPLLCNRYHDIAGKRRNDFGQVAQCIAGIFGKEKISDSRRHMDGDREAANDNGGDARYHEEEGGDSRKHKLRTRARNRWVKVRMNRAFLVKKIRRQVMAERKVSQSETVVTRVERLEKALGVNVYTTGSGRLDVLGREVRLSLAMIVEHQVRVASHVEERGGSSRGDTSRSGSGTAANEDEGTTGHDTEGSEGGSVAKVSKEIERMQDRCARLCALVARLGIARHGEQGGGGGGGGGEEGGKEREEVQRRNGQHGEERRASVMFAAEQPPEKRDEFNLGTHSVTPAVAAGIATSEVLRLSIALAGDLQYLLSRPFYCRVLESFSFTPERKCLCRRDFDTIDNNATAAPATTPAAPTAARRQHDECGISGCEGVGDVGGSGGTGPTVGGKGHGDDRVGQHLRSKRQDQPRETHTLDSSTGEENALGFATDNGSGSGTGAQKDIQRTRPTPMRTPMKQRAAGRAGHLSGRDISFAAGGECWARWGGGLDNAHGFRVRPTLYQCLVLSLGHLSSFLASARSRAAHRAMSSLTRELKRDVLAAERSAREAVAAAAAARAGARQASAEALAATARVASVAVSARDEGSLLLEEFHEQLAKAMRAERDRLEQNNDERARAERERVSQLLETQLGHLTSLLDSKAGQEDLVSITRAMGDVEETLQVVRESVPGENILQELQEALARKADKAYTKRQMALLVSRVSALLKEESDEPAMAKKCLSCDRAFNKLSFKELELAQKLPDVLESVLDAPMHAPQQLQKQQKQRALGGTDGGGGGGGGGLERVRWAGGDWPREAMNGDEFRPPRGRSEQDANKRPGSAPIARARNTLEPRPFSGKRPNSAAPQRLGGGGGTGSITGSSRAGSGGVLPRTAPGRCANPNNNSRSLPPAVARPQPTYRQSLLFLPAALSATYGQHSDSAGKIVESETLRADRVSAREQAPTLDHLRYGGMTEAPLVKQLFAGLGAGIGGRSSSGVSTLVGAAGAQARGTVGARIVTGRWGQGESIAMRGTGGRGRRNGGGYSAVDSGGATGRAADDRMPSGGSGDSREDFSSTLEHHRRNVIAVDEPPV